MPYLCSDVKIQDFLLINIPRRGEAASGGLGEATVRSETVKPLLYEVVPGPLTFEPNAAYVLSI